MSTFEDTLSDMSLRVNEYKENLTTEEATKTSIVLPFIARVFGYDVFNPNEVIPEFTCDVGIKKGEKIDYALVHDGVVQTLIEVKPITEKLSRGHASQLVRYFSVSDARIGILTNGRMWEFYTDLDRSNIMDELPFLTMDLLDLSTLPINTLKKLSKQSFDINTIVSSAEEMKYTAAFKKVLNAELDNPSPEFVKVLAKQVYDGVISQKVLDSFTGIVKKSSRKIIQDKLKDKIQTAFGTNQKQEQLSEIPEPEKEAEDTEKYVTTDDEKQAFYIVRAILAGTSHVSDIVARDRKTYFSVIYKDNGRKPICRFYFNSDKVRYFSYFDEEKNEIKVPIVNLEEIYDHADKLIHVVNHYKREQDAPRVESSV